MNLGIFSFSAWCQCIDDDWKKQSGIYQRPYQIWWIFSFV